MVAADGDDSAAGGGGVGVGAAGMELTALQVARSSGKNAAAAEPATAAPLGRRMAILSPLALAEP